MNRNITGTIRKTDGTVWAGAVLEFELERSSFDDGAQYPVQPVRAVANNAGELTLSLWVNEEAPRPSRYICTLPDGSQFRFTLPEDGSAIDLNELRETAVEDDSPTQSDLIAFLPVLRSEARQTVESELVELNAEINAKADQTALDAANAQTQILSDGLAESNDVIALKANQSALDTTNTDLQTVADDLDDLIDVVATKAAQTSVDSLNTGLAGLSDVVDTKAVQADLDVTNSNVHIVSNDVSNLQDVVAAKANQADLDTTNGTLQTLSDDLFNLDATVATKAAQSALNTTNTNVSNLSSVVATKAAQSSLNTTNSTMQSIANDVTELSELIDTKAPQSALDTAIGDLQDAISAAQSTLQDLIDQKADLAHTHYLSDITHGISNSIAFFDSDRILNSSGELSYVDGQVGLGTDSPEATLDLRHAGAEEGYRSRITAVLNAPYPNLSLISDTSNPQPPLISFDCGGYMNSIESGDRGDLSLGLEGTTPSVEFRLRSGLTKYCGAWIDDGLSGSPFVDTGDFGFVVSHGDVKLVFNWDGGLTSVALDPEGFGEVGR